MDVPIRPHRLRQWRRAVCRRVAVLSALIQASDHAAIAGPLLVTGVLMAAPARPAWLVAQLSRDGRATLGARGVRIPLRGPYRLAAIVVMAPVVLVLLAVIVGHASDIWNRGGWALFFGGWTALVFRPHCDRETGLPTRTSVGLISLYWPSAQSLPPPSLQSGMAHGGRIEGHWRARGLNSP